AKRAGDPAFHDAKIATAHFFAEHILSQASALRDAVVSGGAPVNALSAEQF
ncbi:MAG: acyl-CoA dehydrogenase C-terminal domain-containing protein, partial [Cupriavidus sp.]|nr:acyl-CoA dehydrogenase C-terminal domain-containing protein [Cupriavidus sp.]